LKEYALITDATCDLPAEVLERLNVRVIPMEFQIGGTLYQHYPDAREMSLTEFYERMQAGERPSTSQINRTTYLKYFEAILETGANILYLSLTAALSGTFQASCIVAQELEEKHPGQRVVCMDSMCASIGQGLLLILAAQKKQEGLTLDEMIAWVQQGHLHVGQWFTVDDLNHLYRGGRISSVAAIAGTALGIKPILHVDSSGYLVAAMKVRGRKKSMETLIERIAQTGINPAEQIILVGHGNSEKEARQLKHEIHERFHPREIILCDIGPVIGSHVGPGMLAVSFWASEN
jgi:DegV family protein with EDD domain